MHSLNAKIKRVSLKVARKGAELLVIPVQTWLNFIFCLICKESTKYVVFDWIKTQTTGSSNIFWRSFKNTETTVAVWLSEVDGQSFSSLLLHITSVWAAPLTRSNVWHRDSRIADNYHGTVGALPSNFPSLPVQNCWATDLMQAFGTFNRLQFIGKY